MNNPITSHLNIVGTIAVFVIVIMFILICILSSRLEYYMEETERLKEEAESVDQLIEERNELLSELNEDNDIIDKLNDSLIANVKTIEELSSLNERLMSQRYFETDFVASVNNFIDCLCQAYPRVDPYIVRSIVYHESRYNPEASNGSCVGLTQLSTKWFSKRANDISLTDLQEPFSNLLVCVRYLNELLEDMPIEDGLYEYNHSQNYVSAIMFTANRMRTEVESNGSEATSP